MKKLILLTVLMCGSLYSMDEDQAGLATNSSSSLTEYQKKKLGLLKLRSALDMKQMNSAALCRICPECGTYSYDIAEPNRRPVNGLYKCMGACGEVKSFHEYAYFNKLQREANATIRRLQPLLNESE